MLTNSFQNNIPLDIVDTGDVGAACANEDDCEDESESDSDSESEQTEKAKKNKKRKAKKSRWFHPVVRDVLKQRFKTKGKQREAE